MVANTETNVETNTETTKFAAKVQKLEPELEPSAEASKFHATPEALRLLPADFVKRHRILPLKIADGSLHVATAEPGNARVIDDIRLLTGLEVVEEVFPVPEIAEAIAGRYQVTVEKMIENLGGDRAGNGEGKTLHDIEVMANEPTVINLVNLIISTALRERASDIHFVPFEDTLQLRYRIDGLLQEKAAAAQATACGAGFAHQNHGGHEHCRAVHAAGRPYPDPPPRRPGGHPRRARCPPFTAKAWSCGCWKRTPAS